MKFLRHILGLGLLLAVMVRCGSSPDSPALTGSTSQSGTAALKDLEGIDSLMWKQPDSALTVMLKFAASPEADSLDEFEGHYCQMLISELLYKNYYEQSNREELLKAVDYFDSIVAADGYKTDGRRDAPRASAKNVQNTAFLDARAHYINGVGYYEKDEVVNACAEYIRTLKIMEAHFEERELVGHKARFLAYTYNRLGDLFSKQFMMESAITCYEYALVYCNIEPTSPIGVSNILYRIGKQYDKKNEIENARLYYSQALENMTVTNNMVYRDIVSSKALCDYKAGVAAKPFLDEIKHILSSVDTENELLNRYLTIGGIFFYEGNYDSALFYLKPVFENNEVRLQAQAAGYMRIIYDSIGNKEQSNVCMQFLTNQMKSDGENKALVSKLEAIFKTHMDQKHQKEAEEMREKSIRKTIVIIVPIAIIVALSIIVLAKLRSKKLLKEQQEEADRSFGEMEQEHEKELKLWQAEADRTLEETEKKYEEELEQLKAVTKQRLDEAEKKHLQYMADAEERHSEELREQKDRSEKEIEKTKMRHQKELEAERLAYEKEKASLRQNLMERVEQVRALEEALNQQREDAKLRRMAFLKEPICQSILNKLSGKNITTRENAYELGIALKDEDFEQLRIAVEKHYEGFDNMLLSQCPGLKHGHLALCHLHLLGINESEIAVLKNVSYSAIKKQNESLREKLEIKDSVAKYVLMVAEELCVPQDVPQSVSQDGSLEIAQIIQDIVSNNPKITREEMAHQLGVSSKTIGRYLKKLDGRVRYVGSGYSGHWEVIE